MAQTLEALQQQITDLTQQVQTLTSQATLKDKEIERLEIDNAGLRSANRAAAADVLELTKALDALKQV